MSERAIRVLGALGILGGVILIVNDLLFLLGANINLSPLVMLLLSLCVVGLYWRLQPRDKAIAQLGLALAYIAVLASVFNIFYIALGGPPASPQEPSLIGVSTIASLMGTLFALLLIGLAHVTSTGIKEGWRLIPIMTGIFWMPLQSITSYFLGRGLIIAGLLWICVGYAVLAKADTQKN